MDKEKTQHNLFEKDVRNMTFVLIENNAVLRRTMIRLLKEAGITQIVEADTGKEGMVALKANRNIDIIIHSDQLPDLDSHKFLQSLGQDKKFESTTLVLVSSNSEIGNIQKSIALGVDGYIVKPFALPELKGKIEDAIAMRRKRLAMKDLHVQLEASVQLNIGGNLVEGTCVELARQECQILVEEDPGIGTRLQLQLPHLKEKESWYDPIPGAVASGKRVPQGHQIKMQFRGKPAKSQGILASIHHYASSE
ncbi:MAG: response regulator [SAR324 cluster bacterium]|nr:response regulator [SAR324 cluster bacterium]